MPIGSLQAWRAHPRLLRHTRLFQRHTNKAEVLKRYLSEATRLDAGSLKRHMCHIGAWTALLPLDLAAQPLGDENLSPARVLARLLQVHSSIRLTPWLRGILCLVAARLRQVLQDEPCQSTSHWAELRYSIPRAVWKNLHRQCLELHVGEAGATIDTEGSSTKHDKMGPHGGADESMERRRDNEDELPRDEGSTYGASANSKHLKMFSRELESWKVLELDDRLLRVSELESHLASIGSGSDADARLLRSVIRELACALAPPRLKGSAEDASELLDVVAADRLQAAANLQRHLRRLLLDAIMTWRGIWADEAQIDLMLEHVRCLIRKYEMRAGPIAGANAGRQWGLLLDALESPETDVKEGNRWLRKRGRAEIDGQTSEPSRSDGRVKKRKVPCGVMRKVILEALRALGGEATQAEIRARISESPTLLGQVENNPNWKRSVIPHQYAVYINQQRNGLPIFKLEETDLPKGIVRRKLGYRSEVVLRSQMSSGGTRVRWRLNGPLRSSSGDAQADQVQLKHWKTTLDLGTIVKRVNDWEGASAVQHKYSHT